MTLNERNIFLLDGIGALLSAFLMGLVLPCFSDQIGLPKSSLYFLAIIGLVYACFSFRCFLKAKEITATMLAAIISANVFYVFLTAALLVTSGKLTIWGRAFLITEIIIILSLVVVEAKVYRRIVIR